MTERKLRGDRRESRQCNSAEFPLVRILRFSTVSSSGVIFCRGRAYVCLEAPMFGVPRALSDEREARSGRLAATFLSS